MGNTVTLKGLYESSRNIIKDLIDEDPNDFRLEQVEEIGEVSTVVVSYLMANTNKSEARSIGLMLGNLTLPYERVYKKIQLNNEGQFVRLLMYEHK